MATAVIYPEPEKLKRKLNNSTTTDFDKGYLSRTRTVLRHTPDNAAVGVSGAMSLDECAVIGLLSRHGACSNLPV